MITKITKRWLSDKKACRAGIYWFGTQKETDPIKLIKLCFKEDHFDWANWLITRLLTKKGLGMYAVFSIEQVIDIFEQEFPEDNRPRKIIEAGKKYIINPTQENKKVAYDVATIAIDVFPVSVTVAISAAFTNTFITTIDTGFTTVAAYDAADFAYDVASTFTTRAVAYSDADFDYDAKTREKIINYGIKLLRNEIKKSRLRKCNQILLQGR